MVGVARKLGTLLRGVEGTAERNPDQMLINTHECAKVDSGTLLRALSLVSD